MTDPIAEFNAEATRHGSDITLSLSDGELRYRVVKVTDRLLITPTFEIVLNLAKMHPPAQTVIDLASCRVVSSVELTFIGFVLTQVRFHGGKIRIACPSPVNRRALAMVGFDRLADMEPA